MMSRVTLLTVVPVVLVWMTASVAPCLARDGNELLRDCTDALRHIDNGYRSTNNQQLLNYGVCLGYIEGVISGYREAYSTASAGAGVPSPPVLCFPGTVPLGQIVRIVVNALRASPEKLHFPGSLLVTAVIMGTFPCPSSDAPPPAPPPAVVPSPIAPQPSKSRQW